MMTANPAPASLTAVIVNYRTPHLVRLCIDHLKAFPPAGVAMRIVIVDNGSGGNDCAEIRAAHPDVVLIEAGANLGFAKGNNLALRDLASEYALLINSDALLEDGTLDGMIAALQADAAVGAVGPRVVNVDDGADQDYPYRFPTIPQMITRAVMGPQYPARGHDAPLEIDRLHGACLMTRAVVLRQVGLLDEDFFMYDEDVDWCIRVRKAGWRLLLLPHLRVRHYGGKSSGRTPAGRRTSVVPTEGALRMRHELRRSRYRLYRKHRGAIETALLKILTDSTLLLESAVWLARGVISSDRRRAAVAIVRCNLRIIQLNPFRFQVTR